MPPIFAGPEQRLPATNLVCPVGPPFAVRRSIALATSEGAGRPAATRVRVPQGICLHRVTGKARPRSRQRGSFQSGMSVAVHAPEEGAEFVCSPSHVAPREALVLPRRPRPVGREARLTRPL